MNRINYKKKIISLTLILRKKRIAFFEVDLSSDPM